MRRQFRFGVWSMIVCSLLVVGALSIAVMGYDNWLQESNDARSTGYTPGITMYPINEFPRPTGGGTPTYAYIDDLTEPVNANNGNIQTHIAAWYEGSQVEENLRVAFTTTNSDGVGAIYLVDSDGDNVGNYPIIYENGAGISEGDASSSIAVYHDENRLDGEEQHETVLVAALHDLNDGIGNNPNQVRAYDLNGNLHWRYNCEDWESIWCAPVIWEHPDWGDSERDHNQNDDDYAYVFLYEETQFPGRTKLVSLDLTEDNNGNGIGFKYSTDWFDALTPTYCTPVILKVGTHPNVDTYLFFMLDEWTWSNNLNDWLNTGTRVICIDIDPRNFPGQEYPVKFNTQLPIYDTEVIPGNPPENVNWRYTVNTDPAAIETREFTDPGYDDWAGIVFGSNDGSDDYGKDVFFVRDDNGQADITSYDLSFPSTPLGGGTQQQTDPIVVGSPAVKLNMDIGEHPDEIYVLYKDRMTGRMGTAYFDEVTEIGTNLIFRYPEVFPSDSYLPMSPVITDEFMYVGCGYSHTPSPYEFMGGMVYINLDMIEENDTCGFFHSLPWSLTDVNEDQHWLATPAIIQMSSSEQYFFMGSADEDLHGGYLWRLSV